MKALVVYGTKSGCTQGIAERIGRDLADRGVSVDVVAAENAGDPAGYDAVVVGSGVRAGQWHRAAKAWVQANASALKNTPVAFFTCGMTMTDPGKADIVRAYTDPMLTETGIEPVDIGLFSGWNEPGKFGFAERTVMKVMKTPQGDFRDWAAIDSWADKVGTVMGVPA
jgi:menaquinone-dependent protoporphyrinogen oxidase